MNEPLENARTQRLEHARVQCEEALGRLRENVFKPQCKLTLVMRNPLADDGDLIITDDSLELVAQAIRHRREQDDAGEEAADHPLMAEYEDHCDSIIMEPTQPMVLRWWLFLHRLPAVDKMLCEENGVKPKLFAKYEGKWHRVVMASRFGDVGITTDFSAEYGYKLRVHVKKLTEFTDQRPFPG